MRRKINRNALKAYAPKARREFIAAVTARAAKLGISKAKTAPVQEQGDLIIIGADAYPKRVGEQRQKLLDRIALHGFEQTMEEVAYTWFNRLLAIRFMELHGYLDHGYRVLSHPSGKGLPEILEHAEHLEFPGLDKTRVVDLKLDGTKDAELYRMLLIAQCNALHRAMPFLFERIDDETELLLPDNLLHTDSLIRKLVSSIEEADWQEIEIIGWLYQFYISEKKNQVIGKVVKSEDIPAATQLFTPNWIVKYMVQNSLGARWLATYPDSPLKGQMEYYIEPAEQSEEVQRQLAAITPKELNPEEITLIDPACGSGHILVEAYELFKAIYLERGYRLRDIPRLILEKNLYGLDIDDRAAQMAGFALLMKARADDRRILSPDHPPTIHVMAVQDSKGLSASELARALLPKGRFELLPSDDLLPDTIAQPMLSAEQTSAVRSQTIEDLVELFADAKTLGSLISVPHEIARALPALEALVKPEERDDIFQRNAKQNLAPLVKQAGLLAERYDAVVANPPYMGKKGMNPQLKRFAEQDYANSKSDLFSIFIERNIAFSNPSGHVGMITMHSWMFLSSYENLRRKVLTQDTIISLIHLGARAFDSISGEVVSTAALVLRDVHLPKFRASYLRLIDGNSEAEKAANAAKAIAAADSERLFRMSINDLERIPGSPLAYWLSEKFLTTFDLPDLSHMAEFRAGLQTGDNDRFLRFWHEIAYNNFRPGCESRAQAQASQKKWFPHNKGGGYRKWYGNADYVINWRDDGAEIKTKKESDLRLGKITANNSKCWNQEFYFRDGLTWSSLSSADFSLRANGPGFLFDTKGQMLFTHLEDAKDLLLAVLNSKVASSLLAALSPTLDFNGGVVAKLPIADIDNIDWTIIARLRDISRRDWDLSEESWDFSAPLILSFASKQPYLRNSYLDARSVLKEMVSEMQRLEEENNRLLIGAYELSDELTPDVPVREITLTCNPAYRYGAEKTPGELEALLLADTMRELISYAVGCMMGRHSLAEPGLIYAHAANEGFDPSRYGEFPADDDGIVPVTEIEWFDDDAAVRFEEFLKIAWSPETLRDNLRFMAESLGMNGKSDPQAAIRNYFSKSFFKDHLRTYKKRPIYWLFSSGKHKAFECLVYLHRYNESTLSRMRMEYVTPLQSRIAARIDQLTDDIAAASSSAERTRRQKEQDRMVRQLEELRVFDEELRHYADQRIALDLDDGVKVNYGKFGNLLAERKAITGEK